MTQIFELMKCCWSFPSSTVQSWYRGDPIIIPIIRLVTITYEIQACWDLLVWHGDIHSFVNKCCLPLRVTPHLGAPSRPHLPSQFSLFSLAPSLSLHSFPQTPKPATAVMKKLSVFPFVSQDPKIIRTWQKKVTFFQNKHWCVTPGSSLSLAFH